jgi:hypothetical protein
MTDVITDPSQATPEWITQAVRRSGHLTRGQAVQARASVSTSYTSTIARLAVTYSPDAPPAAPARLFLKLSRLDAQQSAVGSAERRREVAFHNRIAAVMPQPPVAHCYLAAFDEPTGAACLLFDDLSATHFGGESARPPSPTHCEAAIDAFAAFHAFWWDHPALAEVGVLPTPESAAADIAGIRERFPGFADFLGDRLSAPRRRAYEAVLEALPRLLRRKTSRGQPLTLIHGDANLSNVLLPRDPAAGAALIIDWQLWGVSFAAEDLANLMALFWDGERRRVLERRLLTRYHAGLLERGVQKYAWADCWRDYRLAVIVRALFMPMWFWLSGAPHPLVWSGLENAAQAYDDLGCAELLKP